MARPLAAWLSRAPRAVFVAYAIFAAFSTYFCMYAFRKPFTAGAFEGSFLGTGLDPKTVFVLAQIVGYALSKYAGIKVVTEVSAGLRAAWLVGLVLASELALVAFGLAPMALMPLALLVNGLCLGMIWGLVVRYLEGRETAELLLAGLSTSFIVASGAVKDVGRFAMRELAVSETWMPAFVGALFVVPFAASVWLLDQLPPPSARDVALRVERAPMDARARLAFVRRFAVGLVPLFLVYVGATAYRDFRDSYGVEIFAGLGYAEEPALFTATEVPVALGVLAALAALHFVKDNRRGLAGAFVIMLLGAALVCVAPLALDAGVLDGVGFVVATGLGSYLVYVPFNTVLFDRMIAATRVRATAVFAIYVADALGYTGSIGVQVYKDLGEAGVSRLAFFRAFSVAFGVAAFVALALVLGWIWRLTRPSQTPSEG